MNMTMLFIRIVFLISSSIVGYHVGVMFDFNAVVTALAGLIFGCFVILLEAGMRGISVRGLSSAVFGLILGLVVSRLMTEAIFTLFPLDKSMSETVGNLLTLFFSYLGVAIALRGRDEFNLIIPYVKFRRQDEQTNTIVVDTSVIIDGRIVDILKTSFLEARLVVPRFVLKELQTIADSSDSIKRQRGRRGLEILHVVQNDPRFKLLVHEEDFPEERDVDAKLVKLAKLLEAKIFTVDFNLNRIAELQGVKVLNINELSNALKSVVLPGEVFEVKALREGKEHNQAVAYLEDGTMVVIEDGRRFIGQNVRVVVTSALQTQAGRMIFAKAEK